MDIEKLISLVQANRPLWDMTDKRYHARDINRILWVKVANEMGSNVADVKKKWQGLRDVFRKEYNKSVLGRSGDEAPPEIASSWAYFNNMMFLKGIIEHRKLQGNVPNDVEVTQEREVSQVSDESLSNSQALETQETIHSGGSQQELEDSFLTENNSQSLDTFCRTNDSDSFRHTKKRKKQPKSNDEKFLEIEKEKLKLIGETVAIKEDSDYQFLMSLLPYLKVVPTERKLLIRHKMQQILIDEQNYRTVQTPPNVQNYTSTYSQTVQTSPKAQDYTPTSPTSDYLSTIVTLTENYTTTNSTDTQKYILPSQTRNYLQITTSPPDNYFQTNSTNNIHNFQ